MMFDYLINNTPSLKPPFLIDLMQSLVNFGAEEQTKISNISKKASSLIFNFNYPLSNKINKEQFETNILNHFIMRRIGYDTYTAWHIALETKLNEIMPEYNIMFDSLINWDLFNNGESQTRNLNDNKNITQNEKSDSSSNNELTNNSNSNSTNDNRFSKMPQNQIQNVQDGSYMTDYTYNKINSSDNSSSSGNSTNNINSNKQTDESTIVIETINKTVSNKVQAYNDFISNETHIMTKIFNELEVLFYGLI